MTSATATGRDWRHADVGLSALLLVQSVTLFVSIPLGPVSRAGPILLDICHLAFAAICITMLTRHRALQAVLASSVVVLALGPIAGSAALGGRGGDASHQVITLTAFAFNAVVTALVARHVFAAGKVTARRVQGAVLLYLNIAALFSIAYSEFVVAVPGSIVAAGGSPLPTGPGMRTAQMTYFSLTAITTTGFGDILPVHPFARSLAMLEAVIGQLFPATLLARLVALQLAHAASGDASHDDAGVPLDGLPMQPSSGTTRS